MNYPLISEYIEAIKAAEDNLNQLSHLRPVMNDDGQPVMSSGNFAVVFKMKDGQSGKYHAVKCFLKEQEGRAEAYKQITKELENVSSTFLTPIKYYEHELFVDSKATKDIEFPVLLMDWVEGVPLDKYVRENIDDSYELELLTWNFKLMATWLLEQPFAHGDLKPDNIIVRDDGTLVLVDYDGMYVPAMEGQSARELGSPDFRHPQRTEQDFDKRIDDFPIVSIALSLKAIALEPKLLERYGAKDRLLFSEADYRDLGNCRFVKDYFPSQSPELDMLYALFMLVWRDSKRQGNSILAIMETAISQPELPVENTYSTDVTEEDLANAWVDKYGAKYSADKKRLLKGPNIDNYRIIEGTLIIGDEAFQMCFKLQSINIPNSVTQIGDSAFANCDSLLTIYIPSDVTHIGKNAFFNCNLQSIEVSRFNNKYDSRNNCNAIIETDSNTLVVGCSHDPSFVYSWTDDQTDIFNSYPWHFKQQTVIPNSVTKIGDDAFAGCFHMQSIIIPDSVTHIGKGAFYNCGRLQSIDIPSSVTHIGEGAFGSCEDLQSIYIPTSITQIGERAFNDCKNLQSIVVAEGNKKYDSRNSCNAIIETDNNILVIGCNRTVIPDSITKIGDYAFFGCSLRSIVIPNSVTQIGYLSFTGCSVGSIVVAEGNKKYDSRNHCNAIIETDSNTLIVGHTKTIIPNSVTQIGDGAFGGCGFGKFTIPNSVTKIRNFAFKNCHYMHTIVIPDSVTQIGDRVFSGCDKLFSIVIPDSVTQIGDAAFCYCDSLQSIVVAKGNKKYDSRDNCNAIIETASNELIVGCATTRIPDSVTQIGKSAFSGCDSLQSFVIPDSVTQIGDHAFSGCDSLQSIVIPDSVKQIGDGAFYWCDNLRSIVIPKGSKEKFQELLPDYKHLLREQ